MSKHSQVLLVSPRDGRAGFLSDNNQIVTLIAPSTEQGSKVAAGNYATRFPDTTVVKVADSEEAIDELTRYQDDSLALDFALMLFDCDVRRDTREEIACELDDMLREQTRCDYVLDIILAAPLPDEADSEGAIDAVKGRDHAASLIHTVIESQPRARLAFESWLALRTYQMVEQAGVQKVHGALVHFGVFRRLVELGKTQANVDELKPSIVMDRELNDHCDPRILTRLIADYASALPPGVRVISPPEERIVGSNAPAVTDSAGSQEVAYNSERVSYGTKRDRAESQVERIADLFGQGSDNVAQQFLRELVRSQETRASDHPHLVKSLCNVATKCSISGRRDISFECLQRALEFPNGIDAKLYLQIGGLLRDLKEYDRALTCYERAEQLDRGERADAIRLEIIRVSVARGDYDKAETQYLKIPDLKFQPHALFGLGTLYRKKGNLRSAREHFYEVLKLEPSFHAAYAGLAEASKQSGKHHKAIARYNRILLDFPDLSEGSEKVYSLSRSYLFRLTHQLDSALALLSGLTSTYPKDTEVHFQLAKLYMLRGETDEARRHFQQAEGPSLNQVAAQLFITACGESTSVTLSAEKRGNDSRVELPEDRGLMSCGQAFSAIRDNNFELARDVLENTRYVDRLQSDFGAVLKYHAETKLDSNFSYKSYQTVCRLAKRGYRELRESVHSIAAGDFESAKETERRMCLLIA